VKDDVNEAVWDLSTLRTYCRYTYAGGHAIGRASLRANA
jgi:hypothetical protein